MKQAMYKSATAFFWVATAILVIMYWPIIYPVLLKAVFTISIFALAFFTTGAIIKKLSKKHCQNDGSIMEYDSYGGFECQQCGRYEKNGAVRFVGRK